MFLNVVSTKVVFEIVGYLGSAFVLLSFLLKDIKKIRLINIVGAAFFVIYGIYTETWATAFMNLALILVHIYYLVKMRANIKGETENN
jgi:O-antigen/teichoic acid export membrane protein